MRCPTPTPSEIVAAARRYLDAPFHHQGRVRAGLDCAGLLVLTARDLGAEPLDCTTYDHDPNPETLRSFLDAQPFLEKVPVFERQIGDILLMDLTRSSMRGHHLAVTTDTGILHAHAPSRKVVETVLDATYCRSIVGVYRWRN